MMIENKKTTVLQVAGIAICVILVLVMIMPIMVYSFLAVPFADDFSYASNTRDAIGMSGSIIGGVLYRVWYEYLTFEGGMFKVFMMGVGSIPFLYGGLLGLRCYIALIHILFYVSLFVFIKTIVSYTVTGIGRRWSVSFAVFTILTFWIINNQTNQEMYTWALIQSAYVVPIIFMFVSVTLFVKYLTAIDIKRQRILLVISGVLGFLSSEGPFNIAILNCGIIFFACYYAYVQLQKHKAVWCVFGAACLGAIINLVSPGNGIRHGDEWGIRTFVKTFIVAAEHTGVKAGDLLTKTPFLACAILLFILLFKACEYKFDGGLSYEHPIWFGILCAFGVTLTSWPYTFGGNMTEYRFFEKRVDFVLDISFYLVFIIWIMYVVGFVKKHVSLVGVKDADKLFTLGILFFAAVIVLGIKFAPDELTTEYMISALADGSALTYSNYQEELMQKIEGAGQEVEIFYEWKEVPRKNPIIIGLGMPGEDDDEILQWKNAAIARYYGKDSLIVHY